MSEALQLPGVVDVITAKDIPGKKVRTMFGYPEELLAESEVECECVHTALCLGFHGLCVCVCLCTHIYMGAGLNNKNTSLYDATRSNSTTNSSLQNDHKAYLPTFPICPRRLPFFIALSRFSSRGHNSPVLSRFMTNARSFFPPFSFSQPVSGAVYGELLAPRPPQ